jgi:NitT/TauT family transport system ATP-binding protein
MSAGAQITVEGVSHLYRPPGGRPVLALEEVSLEVRAREFLALLGPSGCGKSTLLYLIGGFLPTEQGRIQLEGRPIAGPGPDRGIVFQHFALFPWKTVRGNVLYGLERMGLRREERQKRAQSFIDLVGLTGFEDSYPSQLSGGMQQRAAIAVMSARPGRIKTIVDITLDKSDSTIAKSTAFIDQVDAIWGLVRDEAIKAQAGPVPR